MYKVFLRLFNNRYKLDIIYEIDWMIIIHESYFIIQSIIRMFTKKRKKTSKVKK